MKRQSRGRGRLSTAAGGVLLATLGAAIALGIAELSLRLNPDWVPAGVRVNPPVRRIQAFRDETYDVRLSDGDLFHWMKGVIAPLASGKDRVVARVHLVTDANGFRNRQPRNGNYGIIALGDSFTYAANVPAPWPEKLAGDGPVSVLNLGEPGAGPQIQLEILRDYGLEQRPQWVIMAYFEGNDLYDAGAYEVANPFLLTRMARHLLNPDPLDGELSAIANEISDTGVNYTYPVLVPIDAKRLEMVFFSYYISWLSASSQLIESSQNFRRVKETILETRQLSETMGARFLFVYVPSKPHLYLPYVKDGKTIVRIFAQVPTMELDETGYLQFVNDRATPQLVAEHMDDQARLFATFAESQSIEFLDLTPHFQEHAAAGAELYYPFDTHWNESGHALAAQVIGGYIESLTGTSSSKQPGTPVP